MGTATHPPRTTWLRGLQIALLMWATFWLWFLIAGHWNQLEEGWPYVAGGVLAIAGITLAAFWWPVIGGAALVVAGIAAAIYFDHTFTRLTLALPMVALGMGLSMCPMAPAHRT